MSTGFGYDLILLSVKGPGGARITPAQLRAPRRPRHHASPPKKRRGQRRHHSSASSRSPVRARRRVTQEPAAPRAETEGMMARRHEDRVATLGDRAPCASSSSTTLLLVRPKKSAAVWPGQLRGIACQDNMSKRPDIRRATNGPPTRRRNMATSVRIAGLLPGTRPPPLRTWEIHNHLTQATTAGGRTRMLLRR